MKIECITEKLQSAVSRAERVSGKNSTLPILKCLLLIAKKNTLVIRSTNLDLGVEFTVPAKVEKEGVVAIPAPILNSYLSSVLSKNITLELIDTSLKISDQNATTKIKTMPYEEFPLIPMLSEVETVAVPAVEFLQGLRSVFYSSSLTSIKPELSSVYLYVTNQNLVFAATDSFRLAEKQIPFKETLEFLPTLLPLKNVPEIIRILENGSGTITISQTKNQIGFWTDGVYLTSRVVEGVFPDYRQIIPKSATTEATVIKQDVINALRAAMTFSDKSNQVDVKISPKKKTLEISASNADVGESVQSVNAVITGEDIIMRFNYRYLLDCFPSISASSVTFSFNGSGKPLIIKGKGEGVFTYLVMPMNR